MTTARELAIKGHSVSLFDKGNLNQEASWAAGGILSSMRPWSENEDSAALSNLGKANYEDFASELKEQTNIDPEYYRSGLLMINKSDVEQTRVWASKNNITISDRYDLSSLDMHLPDDVLFLPEIAQVRVPRLLKALRGSLIKHDVAIYENTAITGFEVIGDRCISVQAGNDIYRADDFILTAGAWSSGFLEKENEQIKIKPVLGQMLCLRFQQQLLPTMILDGGHYLIPRKDGHVLIGSTTEDVGFQKITTKIAREELMEWACKLWPEIENAEFVQHWSGLRPATVDGKPYLGRLGDYENIFINAGHFRKGILQAPVCATQIAEMICR